ncbi:hypothetical protein [Ethanoligenens sp.]|uniref:hypothetical protein n=1 Tax=Ethanoligenens sp. TaxID=2099655 RepID=UPI0039ED53BA
MDKIIFFAVTGLLTLFDVLFVFCCCKLSGRISRMEERADQNMLLRAELQKSI